MNEIYSDLEARQQEYFSKNFSIHSRKIATTKGFQALNVPALSDDLPCSHAQ